MSGKASATAGEGTIVRQAAEWLVALSDDASETLQAEFQVWQEADPRHAAAVARMRTLVGEVMQLQQTGVVGRAALNASFVRPRRKQSVRRAAAGAVLALVLGVSCLLCLQAYPPAVLLADLRAGTGEWLQHRLTDNSQLTLNSGSAVNLHFGVRERRIELLRGEVLVEVAPDADRPFLVETEHGLIRALGTRFVVRREDGQTRLYMLESRTAVQSDRERRAGLEAQQVVAEGQGIAIHASGLGVLEAVDAHGLEQAWQRHQLIANERPLGEVLDELSRHRVGSILVSEDVRNLRVSAVLPLDDTARALTLLESGLPIRISTMTPWVLRVEAKEQKKTE